MDTDKFKSIALNMDTYTKLRELSDKQFEMPQSMAKTAAYYIQLAQAPDVSALTESKIIAEYNGASCTPPGSNIMQFFRDRNVLVQTMLLLKRTSAEVRYVYHGWFCAEPTFGDIPEKALQTPFTAIRSDETCLGTDLSKHDLTQKHLIGSSNLSIAEFASASPSLNNLLKKFIALLF